VKKLKESEDKMSNKTIIFYLFYIGAFFLLKDFLRLEFEQYLLCIILIETLKNNNQI